MAYNINKRRSMTLSRFALAFCLLAYLLQSAHSVSSSSPAASARRRPSARAAFDRLQRLVIPSAGAAEPPTKKKDIKPAASEAGKAIEGKKVATPGQAFLTGLVSGAVAGITVDLTLFPLDTVKTRLQARDAIFSWKLLQGVYDGVGPGLVASAPACAAFFGAYDSLKRSSLATSAPVCAAIFSGAYDSLERCLSARYADKYAPLINMAAAAGGDLTQSVVRVPFEVVKQRMQAGVDKTWQGAVSNIMSTSGPKGFFAGWGALALRDLPFDIIEFPLYEALKEFWAERKGKKLETWESSLCGSLAGGIAAGLTTPLDVVKTRLMTQKAGTPGSVVPYKGLLDCLARVAKEEGMGALYRGVVPRVVNIALGGAIFFGAYEAFKKVADRAIVQKDLDVGEWWAGVKERARSMRRRQMSGGIPAAKGYKLRDTPKH